MENDIPDSRILDIEYFADSHSNEMIDFIKEKIAEIEEKTLQMKKKRERA